MKLPLKIWSLTTAYWLRGDEMKAGATSRTAPSCMTPLRRIAEAYGITGIRVEKASEVDDALQRAFAIDDPVLVDVVTEKEGLAIPPKSSWNRPKVLASTCCALSSAGAVMK
ncbi:thiamine pyrophosphate-dependent enzyme [Shigella flexneri]